MSTRARGGPPSRAGVRRGALARANFPARGAFTARGESSARGVASGRGRPFRAARRGRISGALSSPIIDGAEEWVENVSHYRAGGYHPVHLHDTLKHGQYRVVHKLGYGGYSTVWLCQDTTVESPRYVAVKIIKAAQSGEDCNELIISDALKARGIEDDPWGEHICLSLGQFNLEGSYGTHLCLVYPVLGPPVNFAFNTYYDQEDDEKAGDNEDEEADKEADEEADKEADEETDEHEDEDGDEDGIKETLLGICRQTVQAVSALHRLGVVHGDLRPANVLLSLRSLDGLDENEVLDLLGEPYQATIHLTTKDDVLYREWLTVSQIKL